MGSFLLTLLAGAAAGALTARTIIRRELRNVRQSGNHVGQDSILPAGLQPAKPVVAPTPQPAPPEEITPEILMVLTAAVSAFLGKKAKIRRARVAQHAGLSSAWAQQGRVFVQASHNLAPHHH